MQHHFAFFAALGDGDFHAAAGFQAEGVGQQICFQHDVIGEDERRRFFVVVELRHEGGEDVAGFGVAGVAGVVGAVAVVTAAAHEEYLHAALAGSLPYRDDIRVFQAGRVDDAAALHVREAADAVPQRGGALIFHVF